MMRRYLNPKDPDNSLMPDDWFHDYSIPIDKWLVRNDLDGLPDNPYFITFELLEKSRKFVAAFKIFEEWAGREVRDLRHIPHVIEQYDTYGEEGRAVLIFVFKCENNGDTYRIIDD